MAQHYDQHDLDMSFRLFYFESIEPILDRGRFPQSHLPIPERIVHELQEDLEGLVEALRDFGAIVLRPARADHTADILTPFWSSRATPALNIRDQTIILGNTIVDTAPHGEAWQSANTATTHCLNMSVLAFILLRLLPAPGRPGSAPTRDR